jgi:hypothetical protein
LHEFKFEAANEERGKPLPRPAEEAKSITTRNKPMNSNEIGGFKFFILVFYLTIAQVGYVVNLINFGVVSEASTYRQ